MTGKPREHPLGTSLRRYNLQTRAGATDFFQIWSTVDYVVVRGLLRIELFLADISESRTGLTTSKRPETRSGTDSEPMVQAVQSEVG